VLFGNDFSNIREISDKFDIVALDVPLLPRDAVFFGLRNFWCIQKYSTSWWADRKEYRRQGR
jgi:hypothetical protein